MASRLTHSLATIMYGRQWRLCSRQCVVSASGYRWGANSHVLSDRGIADSVGRSGDASFAAVAATTAVETGHVHAVQVIMRTRPPIALGSRLVFSILIIRPSLARAKGRGRARGRRGEVRWVGRSERDSESENRGERS